MSNHSIFTKEELGRYNRHIIIPGFGMEAQIKLKNARVLVIALASPSCPVSKRYLPVLGQFAKEYETKGVAFVLVGALAAVAQGAPITTHDVDIDAVELCRTLLACQRASTASSAAVASGTFPRGV